MASDPILAARRRLGPISTEIIEASSIVEAHGKLGQLMRKPASAAIKKRLRATKPAVLAAQLATTRASHQHLEQCAARKQTPLAVRRGVREYLESLAAWGWGVGLANDMALWAQDDNTGCQTGMLRQRDGSVLAWHTEEDTIGYFDKPRVVTLSAKGEALSAFLYPYLLPGPAFGFRENQFHAVDSLHVRRDLTPTGTFTSVAAWLVWRLGNEIDPAEVIRALSPYVDGCAINVIRTAPAGVSAATYELGAGRRQQRLLSKRAGSLSFQANVAADAASALAKVEQITKRERLRYEGRAHRTHAAVERLREFDPGPRNIVELLANRRGGGYAYANTDVKAHAIAWAAPEGIELYVQSGAAHPSDLESPQWALA